jgi:putative ABC transport system ATP-binding protein
MLIVTENLTKIFQVGKEKIYALNGISLTVKENDYIAIMGPSGSGKSTLMNIIGCLDTPTSGRYYLKGTDVSTMNDDQLAEVRNKRIGFVFQVFNLLQRETAYRNVELPLIYGGLSRLKRERYALEALESVELMDRKEHRPFELSGGQRQRVAIARALVNHPDIILADEPTGNLDSKTSEEILELFDKLHSLGNTMIIVTHDAMVARHARRIIHLLDGKIEREESLPFSEK